jgi:hypothetical protein
MKHALEGVKHKFGRADFGGFYFDTGITIREKFLKYLKWLK